MIKNEIHIWDLPKEKVYIKLKDVIREDLFDRLHKQCGSWTEAGNLLNIKRGDTLLARNWRNGLSCCPIEIVFNICEELNIPRTFIEKHIQEIRFKNRINKRGGNSGKAVVEPKFPIKISEDFAEILGHICGDGSIVITKNKGINLKYTNSEKILIESFQEKINNVFGNVSPNIQVRQGGHYRKTNFQMQYPSILSLIILSIFDCKTKDEKDIPDFILDSPAEIKRKFLRALFDDEGTVNVKRKAVTIGLRPISPLNKIKALLESIDIRTSKIYPSPHFNRIDIVGKENIIKFKKLIDFKHPLKAERLNEILRRGWKFERMSKGDAKSKILSFIRDNDNATIGLISKSLNKSPSTIREHLLKLKGEGLLINTSKGLVIK